MKYLLFIALLCTACHKKAVFYGDSISAGALVEESWPAIVCKHEGWKMINKSAAGTTLENTSPTNPAGGRNFIQRLPEIPEYNSSYSAIFIAYGANDIGFCFPGYSPQLFQQQLIESIESLKRKNWPLIVVLSPYYSSQIGRNLYLKYGVDTPRLARVDSFYRAAKEVCKSHKGVSFVDVYFPGDYLADGLHLNQDGHMEVARRVIRDISSYTIAH